MKEARIVAVPPLTCVALAIVILLTAPAARLGVLVTVLIGIAWTALSMVMFVARELRAFLARDAKHRAATGQILAANWSVELLQAQTPDDAASLLELARRRAHIGGAASPLLIPDAALTTVDVRASLVGRDDVRTAFTQPLTHIMAIPGDLPLAFPDGKGRLAGGDLMWLLSGSFTVLSLLAWLVPQWESGACSSDSRAGICTLSDSWYWVSSRLLGGDPEGLAPATQGVRVLGLLINILGLYVLVNIVSLALRQRISEEVSSGKELAARVNKSLGSDDERP